MGLIWKTMHHLVRLHRRLHPASRLILSAFCQLFLTLFFCEFLIYYFVIFTCSWPDLSCKASGPRPTSRPLRAMILSDPHLLGRHAHWLDKLRREWQMTRSFQTADFLHGPDVVFILGDILDNGQNANLRDFEDDVQRFRTMFASSAPVLCAVGNHDIGFHYRIIPEFRERFEKAFSASPVELHEIAGIQFVLVNSMAFEGDRCTMCREAEEQLNNVSRALKCHRIWSGDAARQSGEREMPKSCRDLNFSTEKPFSRPILLQHFPLFRPSDEDCHEPDEAPPGEKSQKFRGKWECLSKEATDKIIKAIEPRAVFSGHTHHGCHRNHENGLEEWTISSFNWRNKINPTFLMVSFCPESLALAKCFLPNEHSVYLAYTLSGAFLVFWVIYRACRSVRRHFKTRLE